MTENYLGHREVDRIMILPVVFFMFTQYLRVVMTLTENGFSIQPESVVQADGLEAKFECLYPGAIAHGWFLNGSGVDPSSLPPGVRLGEGSVSLFISATTYYNNSMVYCEAFVLEMPQTLSQIATLIVHAGLCPVVSVADDAMTVSWENLFTTNLTFCVDVRSVGSSEIVTSVCVSDTQHNFTSLELCDQFSFTVTPTDGRRNGTVSDPVTRHFQEGQGIESIRCHRARSSDEDHCMVTFNSPLSCAVELMFSSNDNLTLIAYSQTVNGSGGSQYMLDSLIERNRNYTVTVKTHDFTLITQNITSHDIVRGNATPCDNEGAVNTSCTFVKDTTATGYLVVLSEECDSNKEPVFRVEYEINGAENETDGVGSGRYRAGFFDIEMDGLPTHSMVSSIMIGSASVTEVNIKGGDRNQSQLVSGLSLREASIETGSDQVCMTCSSVMHCLALIHSCSNPLILHSIYIPSSERRCMNITEKQRHFVAFYGIRANLMLENYPDKVENFTLLSDDLDLVMSTSTASPSVSSVFLMCLVLMLTMMY